MSHNEPPLLASIIRHPAVSLADRLRQLAERVDATEPPDYYGRGQRIEAFEQRIASLLGKQAALFLPSGTMAQPLALKVHSEARQRPGVALHPTSHLELHEEKGYEKLWGLQGHLVGQPTRPIDRADLEPLDASQLAALALELPMREIGGQLPTWEAYLAQAKWAEQNGVALHLDGARLWQCTTYYQRSLAQIAAPAASVYVSLYKDLDGIAGAVLAGEQGFIDEARVWARRAGGNLIAVYPYVLSGEQGLEDNLPVLDEAVRYAGKLAPALAALKGVTANPAHPPCAMFHLHLAVARDKLEAAVSNYQRQHRVLVLSKVRGLDLAGNCICEISVGRAAMERPVAFWVDHLRACLASVEANDANN